MLKFTIFGIPITVEPWFWAVGFFLGNGFHHLQNGSYISIATWLVIIFFSILVHELGHAIVGYKLGGGSVWIRLWAFGGLAYQQGARFTPRNRRLMIVAGPAAGLCVFIVTVIIMLIIWPGQTGRDLVGLAIGYKNYTEITPEAINILVQTYIRFDIFNDLIWVNLWWSLVNLLPIYPLDGGQLADSFMKSRKKMFMLSMFTAVGVIIAAALIMDIPSPFIIMMFAFFAFQSYQGYEKSQY
jgi:Zn-dependent protease